MEEVNRLVSEGKAAGVEVPRPYLEKLAKSNPAKFNEAARVLREHLEDVVANHPTPRMKELADLRREAEGRGVSSGRTPAETKLVNPQKSTVRQSHDLGVEGGRAKAAEHGIRLLDWDNPESHKGDYGEGIDQLGVKDGDKIVLEYKGESSRLAEGQMSDEWIGSRIAKLEYLNDPMAAELLKAAESGKLRGRVYRTTVVDGKLRTVLESRRTYSATKVRRAYEARLKRLRIQEAPTRTDELRSTASKKPSPKPTSADDPVPDEQSPAPEAENNPTSTAADEHVAVGSEPPTPASGERIVTAPDAEPATAGAPGGVAGTIAINAAPLVLDLIVGHLKAKLGELERHNIEMGWKDIVAPEIRKTIQSVQQGWRDNPETRPTEPTYLVVVYGITFEYQRYSWWIPGGPVYLYKETTYLRSHVSTTPLNERLVPAPERFPHEDWDFAERQVFAMSILISPRLPVAAGGSHRRDAIAAGGSHQRVPVAAGP